jgi:hypothetical protein
VSREVDATTFWLHVGGETNGVTLGIACEWFAQPGVAESLRERSAEMSRQEAFGPLIDPSAWTSPNAFRRAQLIRKVLDAAAALGEAERARREGWGS